MPGTDTTLALGEFHLKMLTDSGTWYGPSGARVTGEAVATHLEAVARLMRERSWDPQLYGRHSGRTLFDAFCHTTEDGQGDEDTARVADRILRPVLCALTGAPYVSPEAWSEHATRTLDDIEHACRTAAAVARQYGPGALPALLLTDPWASSRPVPVDRNTLAWRTAARMLAEHHRTSTDRQAPFADAVLRESGIRGLATLHSNLCGGAPVDYRFTRCPYCSGQGESPSPTACRDVGCTQAREADGHEHLCPVCQGADHDPKGHADTRMRQMDTLLIAALAKTRSGARWRRGSRS
ncbi:MULTISPECIES: hypothetical protein [unclassified Streptomyces]|uniref:DUF6197 family protein n=1 Tax=unclassified Streptomyces TaxID=2593676 RepID=UPI0035DCE48C